MNAQVAIWEIIGKSPNNSFTLNSDWSGPGKFGSAAGAEAIVWTVEHKTLDPSILSGVTWYNHEYPRYTTDIQDFVTVVPVPPSLLLFAPGLLGLAVVRRRAKN